jgi:hypothetical protein
VCNGILQAECSLLFPEIYFLLNIKAKYEIYFCVSGEAGLFHPAKRNVEFILEMSGK